MNHFFQYLYDNKLALIASAGAIASAAVVTMPSPDRKWFSMQTAKEWFYDFSHQVVMSKNTRLSTTPIVTPPSNKEESVLIPKP
jgi:hypothetical protein